MEKDKFNRRWIIDTGIPIVEQYGGNLTIRALHYRLVAAGMTNTQQHYKRVVAAMTQARWNNLIGFDAFLDHDRQVEGNTDANVTDVHDTVDQAERFIRHWANNYHKNRWENQPIYPEVFIEKKALQGVFDEPCKKMDVALCPCKGYPSLTYLYDAAQRFIEAKNKGQEPYILYFGDYDPSGEDIPRSIRDNLWKMGAEVEVKRMALMEEQVVKWKLPPAPAKITDSRSANWDGLGQVELDAIEPNQLKKMCTNAITDIFDQVLYDELMSQEEDELQVYRTELKDKISTMFND